jgi:hypothetical protein
LVNALRSRIDPSGQAAIDLSIKEKIEVERSLVYEYKFSSELGTYNFEKSTLNDIDPVEQIAFLNKRGIKKHIILLSLDEFYNHQDFILKMRASLGVMFNFYYDSSVVMVNQMMFTFYRNYIVAVETRSKESWFWGVNAFIWTNRNVKYDYDDSTVLLVVAEIFIRVFKFCTLLFAFAFISLINALMIRVTIKSSVIVAFWYFKMED